MTPFQPLHTERLELHPLVDSDAADIHAIRRLNEVMKWSRKKVPDEDLATTQAWMREFTDVHASPRIGFAVRLIPQQEGGRIIGSIGLRVEDGILVAGKMWELGYIFHPEVWGKGYATEAVTGLMRAWEGINWEEGRWEGLPREVIAITEKGNEASMNVLRKCGFGVLGEQVDEAGTQCVVFRLGS